MESLPRLTIVVPLYNEGDTVNALLDRLQALIASDEAKGTFSHVETCFVDDGSTDDTAAILAAAVRGGMPAQLLRFSRNFGHQAAVSAGLEAAAGDLVAVIDADLQDPPELLVPMAERLRDGFDVVYAQRRARKEGLIKRVGYWGFYRLLRVLSEIPIPLDSGDFCIMNRRVVDALNALPERVRFPRGLRAWVGFRQAPFEYDRPPRVAGEPKYNFNALYRLATHGVASLTIKPLRVAQLFALVYALGSLVIGGGLVFALLTSDGANDWQFLVLALLIVVGGFVQTSCLYILGAYVGRGYLETKRRPAYIIAETVTPAAPAADRAGVSD